MADTPTPAANDPDPLNVPAGQDPQAKPVAPPPKRRRWVRRVLIGVGVVVVLLLLLVILAPTIGSSSAVKSIVVSKINQRLNGHVQIDDWSFGWTTGLRVRGVRVFDAADRQILQLPSLTTQLSLLDVIRGKYHLGQAVVDGLDVLAERGPDGKLNFEKLAKESPKTEEPPREQTAQKQKGESKLPDVSGELVLKNCRVTYADAKTGTVHLDDIQGDVKIPDINQPITDSLQMGIRMGSDKQAGSLATGGTIAAVKNNVVNTDTADVDQKLQLKGIELASLQPFLGPDGPLSTLAGLTDAQLALQVQGGKNGYVETSLRSTNFVAGGKALSGDTFKTDALVLTLPHTSFSAPAGLSDFNSAHVLVGSGDMKQPMTLQFQQGVVKLAADLTPQMLDNLAKHQNPGGSGQVHLATDLNVGQLAQMLPHALKLVEGVQLDSGKLTESLDIGLLPDRATIAEALRLADVKGRNTKNGNAPIDLRPIDLNVKATSLGGHGGIPDLRDLMLKLDGPVTADVSGKNLAELRGKIEGALDEVQRQFGQIVDMGDTKLAGTFAVLLDSQGDLQPANGSAKVRAEVTLNNLHIATPGKASIDQPSTNVVASATLGRGATLFIEHAKDVSLTARSGDKDHPTLDAQVNADADYKSGKWVMPKLNVAKLALNLRQAQSEFGAFVPSLSEQKLQFQDGSVNATVNASYDGDNFNEQARLDVQNLTLLKGDGSASRQVLKGYTLTADTAADYASAKDGSSNLKVSKLDVTDNQSLVQVKRVGDQEIAVTLPKGGQPTARGKIHLAADLKGLKDIADAFKSPSVVAMDQKGTQLKSGKLAGDVELAQADAEHVRLAGNFAITDITVAGPTAATAITNEKLTIALSALANHDASAVQVPELTVAGDILQVNAKNVDLRTKDEKGQSVSSLAMVRKADVQVTLPSLAKLQAIQDAMSAPEPAKTAARSAPDPQNALAVAARVPPPGAAPKPAPPATPPAPKVKLVSGSATINLSLNGDGQNLQIVPAVDGKDIAFKCGDASYVVGPVMVQAGQGLKLTLAHAPQTPATTQPSAMGAVRQLQLPALHVTAIGSDISLVEPIEVSNPGGIQQLLSPPAGGAVAPPTASSMNGRILVRGNVGPLRALLDALKGEAATQTYGGGYAIDEQFKTANNQIVANGRMDLNELSVDGKAVPERAFNVLSNVVLDGPKQTLVINNVSILASTTKSLTAVLKGTISDLSKNRKFDQPLTLDLSYDAETLWKSILPLLSKETQQKAADWQIAGKYQKQFVFTGSYPAGVDNNKAMQNLSGTGGIQLDKFYAQGATLGQLDVPIEILNGIAHITYAGKPAGQNLPPAATLNGGTMSIGGFTLDLTGAHPRLTTPANAKFLDHVQLNPLFASNYVGWALNNPAFVGANEATGILSATIVKCDNLALDSALTTFDSGHADIDLSILGLKLGNPTLEKAFNLLRINTASLQGDIKNYRVTIDRGVTSQNLAMALGENKRPFRLFGDVRMSDREMLPVTIDLPWALFGVKGQPELQKYLPEGIQIPLQGQVGSPSFGVDLSQIFQKTLVDAGQKALQERLLGGGKNNPKNPPSTQPGQPDNPVGDILNDLFKQKEKKKKPKDGQSQQGAQ